jgi:hypothetical protein
MPTLKTMKTASRTLKGGRDADGKRQLGQCKNTRGLANLLAHRKNGSFPMIGKFFSNGWKITAGFSNDWKNFSAVFQ